MIISDKVVDSFLEEWSKEMRSDSRFSHLDFIVDREALRSVLEDCLPTGRYPNLETVTKCVTVVLKRL